MNKMLLSAATRSLILFPLAILLVSPGIGRAQSAPWSVGLARAKITPTEPVRMAGYSSRTQLSDGVALDLYAKAMAIEDADGHRAVLVTTDLIGLRGDFAESLCRAITERTGLERHQILLNSSHTHTGPTLGLDPSQLDYSGAEAEATIRYTGQLEAKLIQLVADSLQRLEPAKITWGTGVVNFVMNRREFTERGVQLGVNPRGLADRSVPVLRIESADGKLRAVLFGAACHNTTLTGNHLQISGDFAGYAQDALERQYPGSQAMFMQGCAGDANPYPRGSEELARLHGMALANEVQRLLGSELQSVGGPLRTQWELVDLPLVAAPPRREIEAMARAGSWHQFVAEKMLAVLDAGAPLPTHYTSSIALWQFGENLTLVALPGEVVVDYVTMLEKALGPNRLWVAAYSNDVFGYLPSATVIEQGGYETRGLYAGGVGFFAPAAQDVVVEKVRQLARQAGRPTK